MNLKILAHDSSFAGIRTSALSGNIFEAGKNDEVLGSLNIYVPFVMFRGLSLCAEVVYACNESFINASINQ